jgi:UDP-N-acetylmuramyl pentapeptide phosphotransferase/UDP-N-acetylglucosamine-1-phosphate transferase
MSPSLSFILFISLSISSLVACGGVLKYLRAKAILDHPNERSSHSVATPRGGGIGVLLITLPALALSFFYFDAIQLEHICVLGALLALALISWLDDLKNLGPAVRFLVQFLGAGLVLAVMDFPANGVFHVGLPFGVEYALLLLGWVWFINLFNFMDGIDGICAIEVISIGAGLFILSFITSDFNPLYGHIGMILAACALGFLWWNWHPAKMFMGDVGSISIGFLLGWLLIKLAVSGFLAAALILPLYYLMDATITLVKRVLRKEKVWQAHREHYYQQATQKGMRHDHVVKIIGVLNICLIGLSYFSLSHPILALVIALVFTSGVLVLLKKKDQA